VLDAGVVDEDVDVQSLGIERLERGHHRRFVRDIEDGAMCLQAEARELVHRRLERCRLAAIHHHGRPRFAQPLRDGQANAPCGAGDEGGAPGEIEQGMVHALFVSRMMFEAQRGCHL
jgi:hypothetical protein